MLVNEIDQVLDVCLLWFKMLNFVGGVGRADNKEIVSARFMAWSLQIFIEIWGG